VTFTTLHSSYIVQVLSVLSTVVAALGASHMELSKSVNSLLVSLIVSGAAGPTLDLVQDWSKTADPSLLRHFIGLVSRRSRGRLSVLTALMIGRT
jgi:hypothetical protein